MKAALESLPKIQNVLINIEKNALSDEQLEKLFAPIKEMKNLKVYVLKINEKKFITNN